MGAVDREALERDVREACTRGDFAAAATRALEGYGPEIYGFLAAILRNEDHASEVFSGFCESLWRALPAFAWQSSLRTWAYTIARHAAFSFRKGAQRQARRDVPIDDLDAISALVARVRTNTRPYLETERKDRFAQLREELPEEDQMLLILRVDRDLAWNDLARVLGGDVDDDALKREAARLRKRFQLVKEKLVELGVREGLLPGRDS